MLWLVLLAYSAAAKGLADSPQLFQQPVWGTLARNGNVSVELKLPASLLSRAGEFEVCLKALVDEDCVGREQNSSAAAALGRMLRSGSQFDCFEARVEGRKIMVKLQAACWLVGAILRQRLDGEVLTEDLTWVRLLSTDAESEEFLSQVSVPEELEGRRGLFERAVALHRREGGLVLEFGGGESTLALVDMLEALGKEERPLIWTFDWWKGLPRKWRDGFEMGHFSFGGKSPHIVRQLVIEGKVAIVEGLIEDTIRNFFEERAVSATVDLVIIDTCLGDVASVILQHTIRRMRNGTMILFGSYLNFEGWKTGGEHGAWISEAKRASVGFSYVAYYSSRVLIRIDHVPLYKADARSWWNAVLMICVAALVSFFVYHFVNWKKKKKKSQKPIIRDDGSLKKKLRAFRRSCILIEQKLHIVSDDIEIRDRSRFECEKLLSLAIEGGVFLLKEQISQIKRDEVGALLDDLLTKKAKLLDILEATRMKSVVEADYFDALKRVALVQTELRTARLRKLDIQFIQGVEKALIDTKANLLKCKDSIRDLAGRGLPEMLKLIVAEAQENNDGNDCVICLQTPKCMLLLPCAHVCACEECALQCNTCPVCRCQIEKTLKVFI
jgi:hypothetical protein